MNCQIVQESLTAALLTGAALDDEGARHVAVCPSCAAEQASMRQVIEVMSHVEAPDLQGAPIAPANDLHLQRILRAASAERARERRFAFLRRGLVALVAAAVVVLGGVWVSHVIHTDDVVTASASSSGLTATARITPTDEGSSVRVSLSGMPPDSECVVYVQTADGTTDEVLRWTAEYEGTAFVTGNSPVAADDITNVVLKEPDGQVLLEIPVTR